MPILSKPYVITDASRQSEDIDRMFDDVYTELAELERENAERLSGAGGTGGGARGLPGNDGDDADAQWPILVTDTDIARLRLANAFLATNTFAGLSQFNGECSFTSEPITFAGVITASQGMRLPSVQVVSTNPNTLDDYEEGTWTPVLTFATPGNLTVVYDDRVGSYVKVGQLVAASVTLSTSTFTHTTASGACQITGFPFTANTYQAIGALEFGGITKATYTNFISRISGGETLVDFIAGGSGVARSAVIAADMPTGGTIRLVSTMVYRASA